MLLSSWIAISNKWEVDHKQVDLLDNWEIIDANAVPVKYGGLRRLSSLCCAVITGYNLQE